MFIIGLERLEGVVLCGDSNRLRAPTGEGGKARPWWARQPEAAPPGIWPMPPDDSCVAFASSLLRSKWRGPPRLTRWSPPSAPSLGRGHSSTASRKRTRNVPGAALAPGSLFSYFGHEKPAGGFGLSV